MAMSRRRFLASLGAASVAAYVAFNGRRRAGRVVAEVGDTMKSVLYAIEGNEQYPGDAAADQLAAKYDVIVCQQYQFRTRVKVMLANHTGLVMAAYFNATHSQKAPPFYPADWYVYDANGTPVRSKAFLKNYLMNPRSAWKSYVVDQMPGLVAAGYNAVYLDELGSGPIRPDGTTSQACLPGTNQPWTEALWIPETVALAQAVQDSTTKLVYGNGLGNGARYFAAGAAATKALMGPLDRCLGESFLRGAKMPTEPGTLFKATDANWRRDIQMVADAGPEGMFCSKIWSYPTQPSINDKVERWAAGSFLLGCWPKSGWFFSAPSKSTTIPAYRPMYDKMKALGAPLAPATFTGSTGHRNFEHGYVDVNNAATDAVITGP